MDKWRDVEIERDFDVNVKRFLGDFSERFQKIKAQFQDVTADQITMPPTVFYYDADHDRTRESTLHFMPMLADPCILCLDDWDRGRIKQHWRKAEREGSKRIVKEWELPARKPQDLDSWWCGFYVALLTDKANG